MKANVYFFIQGILFTLVSEALKWKCSLSGSRLWQSVSPVNCLLSAAKTDLELRLIYHQKDDNSDAHLFFDLLSYWIQC